MGVDHGCFQAGMSPQVLNNADVVIGLQQVGGEGMAEGVIMHSPLTRMGSRYIVQFH